MLKRVKRWPYVMFAIVIELLALSVLAMFNLIPKDPLISGGRVLLYFIIFSIINFIVTWVIYHERLISFPFIEDVRGVSVLTDDQARNALIKSANRLFTTRYVPDHDYSEGKSLRVGTENTDVYVLIAKEDIFPSDTYIILAISKENPSRWNYKVLTGMFDEKNYPVLMMKLAETLASKPERKHTETIERRNPLTGEITIETITRPASIRKFAQEQLQPRQEFV